MSNLPDNFISTGTQDRAVVDYLNQLFPDALKRRISDIHFLTQGKNCFIQYREAGMMIDVKTVDHKFGDMIDSKIRSRADLNKAESHIAVDGRMSLLYEEGQVDVRVSIVPSVGGRKIVCRLLDQSNSGRNIAAIPMSLMIRQCIDEIIAEPQGLFLVSGPTGSGKTTLLYAILNALHNGKRNIVTIENPVEYTVPKITQINITHNITFSQALRATLRQDPDVILVGEIRDAETAQIAAEAANTGHLVLTTIHANNASLAITRMLDFGVEPQSLAGCLRCVTAQRLVQSIREEDKKSLHWHAPSALDQEWMNNHKILSNIDNNHLPYDGGRASTFYGRMPIIEMIKIDSAVSKAILERKGEVAILNAAINQPQFELLAAAGVRLARNGLTSFEQILEAVGKEAITPTEKSVGQELVECGVINSDQLYYLLEMQVILRRDDFPLSLEELSDELHDFGKLKTLEERIEQRTHERAIEEARLAAIKVEESIAEKTRLEKFYFDALELEILQLKTTQLKDIPIEVFNSNAARLKVLISEASKFGAHIAEVPARRVA